MAVEIVGIVWQIGKDVLKLVKNPVAYLFHYERHVVNFKAAVESLRIIRNDVQARVDAARRRRDRIDGDLEAWLTSVQQVEANATRLENGVRGSVECFNGWHPNCCTHYKLGKEAKETMNRVERLQERGRIFCQNLPYDVPPSINSMLASEDYVPFTSREATIEKVMKALEDEAIRTIGVFGMGGIGKTTLMKEIGIQVKNMGLYNDVVMVEVSHNPDLTRIRKEIAGQLGMKLETNSDVVNKGALLERLQDTKTLVILDNVWEKLNLVEIGVRFGDNRKGCKMVLTTRNSDVCSWNASEVAIEVGDLSKAESWDLFTRVIRGAVDSSILDDYGKDIVNECGNLPLLIAAVGTALGNKDKIVWSNALTKLKKGTLIETEHKKVFSCLELSYDQLGSKEIKSCFLFCCLFPEGSDIEIETLLRYGFSEELFDDVVTLKDGRESVYSTIEKLKACCLLLNGSQEGYVKMHDCVREVAKSIASRPENGFLIKAGVKIQDWPRKEKLKEWKRISLMTNEITMLDVEPDCPNLLTLLLRNENLLKKISDSFFQGMKSLVVLDLSHTSISSIPCVTTLQALFLSKCWFLTDLSQLGEMEKLEILCLSKTTIAELPEEMGRLSRLKLLDLTDTEFLKRIPPKVISNFECLEELYMENSFSEWEIEGKGDGSNARLVELESLNCLTTLYIHVRNIECLSQEISFPWTDIISTFGISVANEESMCISKRTMRLDISKPVSHWVKVLMERSEQLELVRSEFCEVERWEEMFDDGLPPALKDLKLLKVYNDWGESFLPACLLHCQKIEELEIEGCQKMKKIVLDKDGDSLHPVKSLQPFIFENLQFLVVRHCLGFKNLLSWRLAPALKQLKGLMVDGCNEMEVIIANEGEEDTTVLPCLQHLYLSQLPKLRSFCEGEALLELPSLLHITVTKCLGLKRLPLGTNSALSIADTKGESEWFEALEWAHENARKRFHELFYRPDKQRLNTKFVSSIEWCDEQKRSADDSMERLEAGRHVLTPAELIRDMLADIVETCAVLNKMLAAGFENPRMAMEALKVIERAVYRIGLVNYLVCSAALQLDDKK